MAQFNYVMSESGRQFHESDKEFKLVVGPYGSGKSIMCAVDLLTYACAQRAAPDGVRYSRVVVVRSTYPELQSTTRNTLMEVLPSEYGSINESGAPMLGLYVIPLDDGTVVHLELQLVALKSAADCVKVLSTNYSFAWINEATGVEPAVFTAVHSRVARYPSQDLGGGSWAGVILDFNQPEVGSWLHRYLDNPLKNMLVVKQPPAAFMIPQENGPAVYEINPNAENLRNLGAPQEGDPDIDTLSPEEYEQFLQMKGMRYYRSQIDAQLANGREDIVQNQYCMLPVAIVAGKPVYTNFSLKRHIANEPLKPVPYHKVIIGCDTSGIHPAAVIVQMQGMKWCVLDELYAEGEGLENFLHGMLVPLLRSRYATCEIVAALDPSNPRDDWQALTPKRRFEEVGITACTEIPNSPKARISAVEHLLNQESGGLLISPACEMLTRGFMSEYKYRQLRATGTMGSAYTPTPEKNEYSHIHDALQYFAVYILRGDGRERRDEEQFARNLQQRREMLRTIV